jgi:hypothetical protein
MAVALPLLAFVNRSGDGSSGLASFDPAAPCAGVDRQMWPGSYPALEARIPSAVAGVAPDRVDSGRFCSERTLGSIHRAGITEVRFAGGRWSIGDGSALELGVYQAPGLTAAAQAAEYERSAATGGEVTVTAVRDVVVDGRPGHRLELAHGDARQVIIIWPSADGTAVQSVTGLAVTDELIDQAIAAFR